MPSEDRLDGQVALVTGGGRGIGANIARALAAAGAHVAVAARSLDEVRAVAHEIHGEAFVVDVASQKSVDALVVQVESVLGPIDLLVANAGIGNVAGTSWDAEPSEWWHVFEVNVLGVHHCCRAVIPDMLDLGRGRIIITASGAAYLPGLTSTAYASSKAAVSRYGETLANELRGRIPVFFFSPGLVQTEMTSDFPGDAPWTPPELAPKLAVALASGRADALAGRYIHAEHDDIEDLIARAEEIVAKDLNAIRLQR